MSTVAQLRLITGFGLCLRETYLLAYHPLEWDQGEERTLLLSLNHGRPRYLAALPFRVGSAWRSRSGATYLSSWRPGVTNGSVYVHTGGAWQGLHAELQVTEDRLLQHRIWGISGATPAEDVVFVGGAEITLYVRRQGVWNAFRGPPECGEINGFHGLMRDAVYLCSPELGLLRWDGERIDIVPSAFWGDYWEPQGVMVISDQELLVTHEQSLWRWRKSEDRWQETETGFQPMLQFVRLGDEIFSASYGREGVIRLQPDPAVVAPIGDLASIVEVGDGVIAAGEGGAVFYDGSAWREIHLPRCEAGTNSP